MNINFGRKLFVLYVYYRLWANNLPKSIGSFIHEAKAYSFDVRKKICYTMKNSYLTKRQISHHLIIQYNTRLEG